VSVTYSTVTGKVSIQKGGATIEVTAAIPALGFTVAQAVTGSGVAAVGDAVVVLKTTDLYHIHIENATGQYHTATSSKTPGAFVVPVDQNTGAIINYTTSSKYLQQLVKFDNKLAVIHVYLRDDSGNAISLNGAEWSFLLTKQC
jgi:hypothetical protein